MVKKHELKNIELFKEDGQYYLKLKYVIEDDHTIRTIDIPKAQLPVNPNVFPVISTTSYFKDNPNGLPRRLENSAVLYAGGDAIPLCTATVNDPSLNYPLEHEVFYVEKTIKEKRKEMTVSEIEKKLGYKIKIVAEG